MTRMLADTSTMHTLDPIAAIASADLAGSDGAAATAARLELIALVAETAAPKGLTTECTIFYRLPGQRFARSHTMSTDYAGIWAWLLSELGTEMAKYGMADRWDLFQPGSPIKVAFARQMPAEDETMPDRTVVDGNCPELMRDASMAFTIRSVTSRTVNSPDRDDPVDDLDDLDLFKESEIAHHSRTRPVRLSRSRRRRNSRRNRR